MLNFMSARSESLNLGVFLGTTKSVPYSSYAKKRKKKAHTQDYGEGKGDEGAGTLTLSGML